MKIDFYTFNVLEFIVAFVLAISLWVIDKLFVKPKFSIEVGGPSLLFIDKYKTLNLKIKNKKRKGIALMFNQVATQVRIYLYFLDYPTKAEFNKVIARWNNSREPVTPDYKQVDIGLALTNPREVLVPGEEQEISVVIRKKDNQTCYPFNNQSYLFPDYAKPKWEITDDKFLVKVKVQSAEIQDFTQEFLVLNKTEQFEITKSL